MKYLFSDWKNVAGRLKNASHRLYLFDIDGTLAAIEKTPEKARIQEPILLLLYMLSLRPRTTVGIISGRALDDARSLVGIHHLIYAGNHGLEVCFNGRRHIQPHAQHQVDALKRIYHSAKAEFAGVPGALVEGKGLSLSLHYRLVDKNDRPWFDRIVKENILPLLEEGNVQLRKGKKVLEIIPSGDWGKGNVVEMLMKNFRMPVTVFTGDDATDESAFGALGPGNVSIRVGRKERSKAAYYLKSQLEVKNLLQRLVNISRPAFRLTSP